MTAETVPPLDNLDRRRILQRAWRGRSDSVGDALAMECRPP